MFLIGFGLGTIFGYALMLRLSNTCERYEVIEQAAHEGSQVCRNYMNYKYGTWRI